MAKLEVCFSPDVFPFYENKGATVVVIDIFRATSAMCTAFANGVEAMIPVARIEDALDYKKRGFMVAAERKGEVVEGFHIGNSPFHYLTDKVKGETIVITTTNGTRAIEVAKNNHQVVIGSFLNLSRVCSYLREREEDVILLCAGWKGRFNLEDSLFAGAVIDQLSNETWVDELSDSALASQRFYKMASGDLHEFLANSSHRRRLAGLNLEKDIEYCLQVDLYSVLPILHDDRLLNVSQ